MKRVGTALIALIAVLALAAAAGSYTSADRPTVSGGDVPTADGSGAATPGEGDDSQSPPAGADGGDQVGGEASGPAENGPTSGGVSPLFVALFVGALLAGAVLAVLLTGDDDRAPRPDDADGERGDPRPTVEVRYGSPGDNAVVRAWARLTDAVDATATDTPGETAERATDRGFPADAVARLRENFLAVRYGDEPVDGREREVRDALDGLDRRRDATTDRGDEP